MADRPILFSTPMVRALLDGRKTQTRRILKPQPSQPIDSLFRDASRWWTGDSLSGEVHEHLHVPYAPGDRLWVRERTYGDRMADFLGERVTSAIVGYYFADDAEALDPSGFNLVWLWEKRSLPSIHMPRFFSRLTLIVEAVRVEQLRNISDADSLAEGVGPLCHPLGRPDLTWVGSPDVCAAPSYAFKKLWESINGTGSWDANLWVAAITFRVVRANIDALTDDGRPIREAAQ